MVPPKDSDAGVSLTETLMVLAVGSGLMVMSMRVYYQWTEYKNAQALQANVEQLQNALNNYYQANCRAQRVPETGNLASAGTLDPDQMTAPAAKSIPMTINSATTATDLVNTGFLTTANWHPQNPLVDSTSGADSGYYVQYDRIQTTASTDYRMSVYACPGNSSGPTTCTASATTLLDNTGNPPPLQSTVIYWMTHVAVKLLDASKVSALQLQLNATCITTDPTASCQTGAVVLAKASDIPGLINTAYASPPPPSPPSPPPPPPPVYYYLIWEQPVSKLAPDTASPLWMSSPQAKQFNMQYTNDGMSSLSGVTQGSGFFNIKNYLCGD